MLYFAPVANIRELIALAEVTLGPKRSAIEVQSEFCLKIAALRSDYKINHSLLSLKLQNMYFLTSIINVSSIYSLFEAAKYQSI